MERCALILYEFWSKIRSANCGSHDHGFQVVLAKKVEELSLNPDFPADAKGIPKFWLHVLKNGNEEALMGLVEDHDEAVLENLTNINVALDSDNTGFTLSFHFQENEFFTNQVHCQQCQQTMLYKQIMYITGTCHSL